jgi:argininosuccinate lyase
MSKKQKSWEKRLAEAPDNKAIDFVQSLSYDRRLYKYDIAGSIAHAEMLKQQKLISEEDYEKIKEGLLQIEREIDEGKFKFDKLQEDIHMAIESALIDKVGQAGGKLHTGRSRNDQVAADIRLWMRDEIEVLQDKIAELQKALVKSAGKYVSNIMPSYTHLQRAQPVSVAGYLLSFVEQFERDYVRLCNCFNLLNVSPLGSGAIAGSTLALDRLKTAGQLGFGDISGNSIDAVSDRDFCAEFIFDCSLISIHLSRLAEDWIIFSSSEFDFIKIADKYCTSSSMMPQKRNPDMLELIRGRTGRVIGSLVGMLTVLKALPSGYNRDLQEDKVHIFTAADTVCQSLDIACGIVQNTSFNTEKIKSGIDAGFLDATAFAEYLVLKKVPFRQAHQTVAELVVLCEKQNKKLSDLSLELLKKYCPSVEKDIYEYIGTSNVVRRYATAGAAGLSQSKEQIEFWQKHLKKR